MTSCRLRPILLLVVTSGLAPLFGVPGALATTSSTVDDIATGAVRYAGSVAKLLG